MMFFVVDNSGCCSIAVRIFRCTLVAVVSVWYDRPLHASCTALALGNLWHDRADFERSSTASIAAHDTFNEGDPNPKDLGD